ncbi:hypothetical protein CIHG_09783 [Coccidioides immitis H538.4]|uniref:Uncharacterized protein n=2 Tax=Coccidioides immitis TaxID=5501 RepID=A0A0J8S596_COCIT|nr:hypothetical protein CIRG_06619 [Coccidioides immitis RMSCC 2394]KMU92011.1 hypothetical protein CIHG_09783 [Coccidioides immitis H538.4]
MACLEKSLSSCGQMDLLEIVPGPVALQHGIDWERRGTREKECVEKPKRRQTCRTPDASNCSLVTYILNPRPLSLGWCEASPPGSPRVSRACATASLQRSVPTAQKYTITTSYRCQEFPSRNHKLDLDVAQFSDGDCRELGGPDDPADPKKTSRQWHQSGFAFMYHDSSSPWDAMMVTPEGRNYGTALASFSADENNLRVCLRAREALVTRVNRKPDLKGDTDDNGEEAPLCGGAREYECMLDVESLSATIARSGGSPRSRRRGEGGAKRGRYGVKEGEGTGVQGTPSRKEKEPGLLLLTRELPAYLGNGTLSFLGRSLLGVDRLPARCRRFDTTGGLILFRRSPGCGFVRVGRRSS